MACAVGALSECDRGYGVDVPLKVPHVVHLDAVIEGLVRTVQTRDPYTAGHQHRVAALCRDIARRLGLDEDRIRPLCYGALIHDLGKTASPSICSTVPGDYLTLNCR